MASVAVIGAGVGGLVSALYLRGAGHDVTVYERNDVPGGKLASRTIDGFSFDIGPSLLTWPSVFADAFAAVGTRLREHVELVRLDRQFNYQFSDSTFDVWDSAADTAESISHIAGADGKRDYEQFMKRAKKAWDISENSFLTQPVASPWQLVKRMRSPFDLSAISPNTTLAARSRRAFKDERLQMWLNRYATYSGSDPWRTPQTAMCIPFLEQDRGCWHVRGGLAALARALHRVGVQSGIHFEFNADVDAVTEIDGRVSGVEVLGLPTRYDAVVSDVDAEHLYRTLIPKKQVDFPEHSTAGFALLLGLSGNTPGMAHHTVIFSSDQEREFAEIRNAGIANEPTIYICNSSVSDASQAPEGKENWFVLVNVGAGTDTDWDGYGNRIIDRLGIRDRIEVREQLSPTFYADRYRAPGGAIYGSSSNSKRSAFLRATNRGVVPGLFVAGGSAHPGGGLPLVAQSGRIAASLATQYLR